MKKVFIQTYGCQMNLHDSEIMAGILSRSQFQITSEKLDADVILLNTCSVRENAEKRVLAQFRQLRGLKKKKPGLKLGVCGCMAQAYGQKILDMNLGLDVVVGPDAYTQLPELLARVNGTPLAALELSDHETYARIEPLRTAGLNAWISIMRGCNNYCTYCIVPYVRGRERSQPVDDILRQIDRLPDYVREFTLLGQNVNSYNDRGTTFAQLLRMADQKAAGRRIRFTTSHPKDFSDEIIRAMHECRQVCAHVHLPLQSGSDRVLALMNRQYTTADYLRIIEKIRKHLAPVSITTDLLVGFPGETDVDFQQTRAMMQTVEFDSAFYFKYSPRPGTAAARLGDSVPAQVKAERLTALIDLQHGLSQRVNRRYVGITAEVLVEGESKKNSQEWRGRTRTNKYVVFPRNGCRPGDIVNLTITDAAHVTLFGAWPGQGGFHVGN